MSGFWSRIIRTVGKTNHDAVAEDPKSPLDRIIIGLGNPGSQYERNRHNVGFMVLDNLAHEVSGVWSPHGKALTCRAQIAGCRMLLVKPLTYMNRSGDILPVLLEEYECEARDIVVLFDDLSLPLGRIRVRERGSTGGHHGLESILAALDTDDIVRVRLGIGEENMPKDKASYVLSDFPPERQAELDDMIAKANSAVKSILNDGVAKTMAIFNGSISSAVKE